MWDVGCGRMWDVGRCGRMLADGVDCCDLDYFSSDGDELTGFAKLFP